MGFLRQNESQAVTDAQAKAACVREGGKKWCRVDHSSTALGRKVRMRRYAVADLGGSPFILDAFCGTGHIYRACYAAYRGVAIDTQESRARDAARERREWAVYCGRAEDVLAAGLLLSVPFDLVDFDAYGSPFRAFAAWCRPERTFASRTWLFLTDGYMLGMRVKAAADPFLFGESTRGIRVGKTPTDAQYDAMVQERVTEHVAAAGLTVDWWRTDHVRGVGKAQRYHTVRLLRAGSCSAGPAGRGGQGPADASCRS